MSTAEHASADVVMWPRILVSHIPLHRPSHSPCGPLRGSRHLVEVCVFTCVCGTPAHVLPACAPRALCFTCLCPHAASVSSGLWHLVPQFFARRRVQAPPASDCAATGAVWRRPRLLRVSTPQRRQRTHAGPHGTHVLYLQLVCGPRFAPPLLFCRQPAAKLFRETPSCMRALLDHTLTPTWLLPLVCAGGGGGLHGKQVAGGEASMFWDAVAVERRSRAATPWVRWCWVLPCVLSRLCVVVHFAVCLPACYRYTICALPGQLYIYAAYVVSIVVTLGLGCVNSVTEWKPRYARLPSIDVVVEKAKAHLD